MEPVREYVGGWGHDLSEDLFDTREEALEDYKRCAQERKACPTGGCDE